MKAITFEQAEFYAHHWLDVWNNDDLDDSTCVISNDATLISSLALRLFPDSHGRLKGKTLLREYWIVVKSKFSHFKFVADKIDFYENKAIVFYHSIIDNSKAIAILSIGDDDLIYKIEVSMV